MLNYYDRKIAEFKSLPAILKGDGKIVNINLHRDREKFNCILRMREAQWDFLKEFAYDHGIPLKSLIKIILNDFVDKCKKSEYLFKRFGI